MVANAPFATIEGSIVDITGADADAILHNLTSNDVRQLAIDESTETFITNVKGRAVGHGTVVRTDEGFRFVGAPGQSDAIAKHVDRYTIREDATASVHDDRFRIEVWKPGSVAADDAVSATWLGVDTRIRWVESNVPCPAPSAFHDARIDALFPWHGIDCDDSNLPQELSRDDQTISFVKGCYLGQETIARLDAMGQVQKKMVKLSIQSDPVDAGEVITVDGKPMARITSVKSDGMTALAMVRRAWFEPGTEAMGQRADGTGFSALVG